MCKAMTKKTQMKTSKTTEISSFFVLIIRSQNFFLCFFISKMCLYTYMYLGFRDIYIYIYIMIFNCGCERSKTCQPIMRNALMQVVHDIQMLKNNVTLHEEGKKYPMPIIKKPRLFRKASLQVLRRRYQNSLSLSLSLSLSVVRPEKLQRKKSQYTWE